jgi:hypothetical protein
MVYRCLAINQIKVKLKNQLKMAVIFKAENHKYESLDPNERINWISVTSFVGLFKQKFDPVAASEKASKNPNSKWYGLDPQTIRNIWQSENGRAVSTGSFYHEQRELDLNQLQTIQRQGIDLPIIKPIFEGNVKIAPEQKLKQGIYPEHFVYLKSAGICGQSDRVEVVKDTVDIIDYKTNKEIRKEGFKNWEGITQKMTGPVAHLDDCNFNHYALQLSTYMYIILKHNPRYKPGKMWLHHIIFEKEGEDKYGYPILKRQENGDPIVKTVIPYEVPYLKTEVIAMINWLKDNKIQQL